jgi:hypothetical protein
LGLCVGSNPKPLKIFKESIGVYSGAYMPLMPAVPLVGALKVKKRTMLFYLRASWTPVPSVAHPIHPDFLP